MSSVQNLSNLGSMAIHTLREGSTTERFVIGSVLVGTGLLVAFKLAKFISGFFTQAHKTSPVPIFTLTKDREEEIRAGYEAQYPVYQAPKPEEKKPTAPKEEQPRSLIRSLAINGVNITTDKEKPLAEALHVYQKLKTEIGGDDDRFLFFADSYLKQGNLPPTLIWEQKDKEAIEALIPPSYNTLFAELSSKLGEIGLSLKSVIRTNQSIAQVQLKNNEKVDIFDLSELYKTIKLKGPHYLSNFEIDLNKREMVALKKKIHESRLKIIERTLSTVRGVFIDDLVTTFPEKHKAIYAIFESNPETLRFMLENICWHALDRAFETIEITFTSNEKQKNIRKVTLEAQLANVLKDKGKRDLAQSYLLEILANPYDEHAMAELINLLLDDKENSPEKEAFIKKLQEPKLQSEEESIHLEHARLEAVLRFYHAVSIAAAVADEGKNALIKGNSPEEKHEKITFRAAPVRERQQNRALQRTYGAQIEELSHEVVSAGENAVKTVASERWDAVLKGLDQELKELPPNFQELAKQVIDQGWVKFNRKEALLPVPGKARWLMTQKMLIEKLKKNSLQIKGGELVHEMGKGVSSFVKTLYGRLVTALLAFDKRTRLAAPDDPKPADRIATTFLDSILQCYQALKQAKKVSSESGRRELAIVKELEKADGIHSSASNKPSADAVFFGKLIIELLSILQPEGFTADIRKILTTALTQPGEQEPTLIRQAIEKYALIRPTAGPWIKPLTVILVQALENIIEKRSTDSFAKQLSDWLKPANINAYLVDFFKESDVCIQAASENKVRTKWYEDDERLIIRLLPERAKLAIEIKVLEQLLEEHKKNPQIEAVENISQQLIATQARLAGLAHLKKEEPNRSKIASEMKELQGQLEKHINTPQNEIKEQDSIQFIANQKRLAELVRLTKLLQELTSLEGEFKALQKLSEDHNNIPRDEAIGKISQELVAKKTRLEIGDIELAPLLLRRYLIANAHASFVPYVLQFADDLFELIQYPRILRHIVFNVLEKSVQSLAKPLEDHESAQLLQQPLEQEYDKSVFDFLFSDHLKTSFGNKLNELFYQMAPTDEAWTYLGLLTKVAAKTIVPGQLIFSRLQKKVEKLIRDKFLDPEASNYSVAKLVVAMNAKVITKAKDQGEKGLTARIATQLRAVISVKEKSTDLMN